MDTVVSLLSAARFIYPFWQFGEIEEALKDSITSMDVEIVNEAVLEAAAPVSSEDKKEAALVRELKLESLKAQNEMIDDEREDMQEEEDEKAKEKAEKEAEKEKEEAWLVAEREAEHEAGRGGEPGTRKEDPLEPTMVDIAKPFLDEKAMEDPAKAIYDPADPAHGEGEVPVKEEEFIAKSAAKAKAKAAAKAAGEAAGEEETEEGVEAVPASSTPSVTKKSYVTKKLEAVPASPSSSPSSPSPPSSPPSSVTKKGDGRRGEKGDVYVSGSESDEEEDMDKDADEGEDSDSDSDSSDDDVEDDSEMLRELEEDNNWTVEEAEALETLALESAVEKERAELEKMKKKRKAEKIEQDALAEIERLQREKSIVAEHAAAEAEAAAEGGEDGEDEFARGMRRRVLSLSDGSTAEGSEGGEFVDVLEKADVDPYDTTTTTTTAASTSITTSISTSASTSAETAKEGAAKKEEVMVDDAAVRAEREEKDQRESEEEDHDDEDDENEDEDEDDEEEEEEDLVQKALQEKLDNMLEKLEVEIDTVDEEIGDKLNVLGWATDGVLTTNELRRAVQELLVTEHSVEEAEAIVAKLDRDHDGQVSVDDLKDFARVRVCVCMWVGVCTWYAFGIKSYSGAKNV